jgi:CheY-like chemotaxis protein
MAKILLVEDNDVNRDLMVRRLQKRGFTLVTAADGEQAVASARSEKPDLILMDMSLPVMNGWDATRTIKSDAEIKNTPVIGLTAHAMVGDREEALKAGCDDYATKPVDFEKLVEMIDRLLAKR